MNSATTVLRHRSFSILPICGSGFIAGLNRKGRGGHIPCSWRRNIQVHSGIDELTVICEIGVNDFFNANVRPAAARVKRMVTGTLSTSTETESDDAWSRVTAISVTYNSAAVIGQCLRAIASSHRVIMIDNASADDTIAAAMSVLPSAEIIRSHENLGFGRANNLALQQTTTEFALLINPDACLRPGSLEGLVRMADLCPDAAIIGPTFVNADGSYRLGHDVPYDRRQAYPPRRHLEPAPEGPFCTWSLPGAAMLLRMDAMREVGFFDPNMFLYFEDTDLCLRTVAAGFTLVQEPRAMVDHTEGNSSMPSLRGTWVRNRSYAWSRLYLIEKHWGYPAALKAAAIDFLRFTWRAITRLLRLQPHMALSRISRSAGILMWGSRLKR